MTLVVDSVHCVEQSDESGSDDVYLIGFIGRTVPPLATALGTRGPGALWSNFDTGEKEGTDVDTGLFTAADALYAVMLVEEDAAKDISGDQVLGEWKFQTNAAWKATMLARVAGGLPTNSAAGRSEGFIAIKDTLNGLAALYMELPFGDDDVLNTKRVTINQPGQSQVIRFRSDAEDATYDVFFKHKANA